MSIVDNSSDIRSRLAAAEAALVAIGQRNDPIIDRLDIAVLIPAAENAPTTLREICWKHLPSSAHRHQWHGVRIAGVMPKPLPHSIRRVRGMATPDSGCVATGCMAVKLRVPG